MCVFKDFQLLLETCNNDFHENFSHHLYCPVRNKAKKENNYLLLVKLHCNRLNSLRQSLRSCWYLQLRHCDFYWNGLWLWLTPNTESKTKKLAKYKKNFLFPIPLAGQCLCVSVETLGNDHQSPKLSVPCCDYRPGGVLWESQEGRHSFV